MLYIGACRGISPPDCQPCGSGPPCELSSVNVWSYYYEITNWCDSGWSYTDSATSQTITPGAIQEQARPCLEWSASEEIASETLIVEWSDGDWYVRLEVTVWQGPDGVMRHSLVRSLSTPYPPSDPCEDNGQGETELVSDYSTTLPRPIRIRVSLSYGPRFYSDGECSLGSCYIYTDEGEQEIEVAGRGNSIEGSISLEWA